MINSKGQSKKSLPRVIASLKGEDLADEKAKEQDSQSGQTDVAAPVVTSQFHQPSPELIVFLGSMNLTIGDLSNTPLSELEHLLNQGWYGKLLNAYASNYLLFKLITWWMLDKNGIKSVKGVDDVISNEPKTFEYKVSKNRFPVTELGDILVDHTKDISSKPMLEITDAKPADPENSSTCKYCNPLIDYFKTRIWPKNKILLIESAPMLTKAYTVESSSNSLKAFNKVCAFLIFSLLANDIYYFYKYPENRHGNTLAKILLLTSEHSKMLTRSATSITVWPELIGIPLALILIAICRQTKNPTCSIPLKEITVIKKHWEGCLLDDWQQIGYPLLRFILPSFINKSFNFSSLPNSRYDFDNVIITLLWDGHIPADKRIYLFNAIKNLLNHSAKLLRLELLTLMENLAENIHPEDVKHLYQYGYDQEVIKSLLYIQGDALAELKKHAHWGNSWIAALYAHFLLWNIGQPQSKVLEPFFWAFQTYRWYAMIYFLTILGTGIKATLDFYRAKKACEDQGKLWIYVDQIADYACTICGDLPIYYGHIFTNEACIYSWFEIKLRTAQELIEFIEGKIGKVDFSSITTLNFDKQYLNGEDLSRFLSSLKERAPRLHTLKLSMIRPAIYAGKSIDYIGMRAITDFIAEIPVKNLYLSLQFLDTNATKIFGPKLNTSSLQILDLYYNNIGDVGAISLGQNLHGSSLRTLYLSYNNIGDAGANGLGQGLPGSSLQTLYLSSNNIGDAGANGLGQGLPGSSLQTLYLSSNNIGDAGANGLGQGLPGSSLQTLYLSFNNIGDAGAIGLGQNLNGSSLQTLYLSYNSIGGAGANGLGQGLSGSFLQTLELSHNSIGDAGAIGLGQKLHGSLLQTLDLSYSNIGALGVKNMGQNLNSSFLQALYLGYNNIASEGVKELVQGLPGAFLQTLDLSSNNIGTEGANSLGQRLPTSSLQTLDLSYNNIGDEGARGIMQGLPSSSLQTLYLSYNNIGNEGANEIGQKLPGSLLQTLYLVFNNIGDTGAEGIGQNFNSSFLQALDLAANNIGDEGVKGLVQNSHGSSLQILYLSNNNIGNLGAESIGLNLHGSPLQTLYLSYNNIGDEGASRIGQGLPDSSLQILYLSSNNIGDEGASGIGQRLPGSPLQILYLSNNKIGNEGASGIGQGLPGSSLRTLCLSHNNVGDEGAIAIANSLATAPTLTNNDFLPYQFDLNLEKAISQPKPNTNLEALDLESNNITDVGASALCWAASYCGIFSENLLLAFNPVTDADLMYYCKTSAASPRFELPFHLRIISKLFLSVKELIWPKPSRQKFYYNDGVLTEEIDDDNDKQHNEFKAGLFEEKQFTNNDFSRQHKKHSIYDYETFEPFYSSTNSTTLFNTAANSNYLLDYQPQVKTDIHQALPSLSFQFQNNVNITSNLSMFFLVGVLLLWICQKSFNTQNKHKNKFTCREQSYTSKKRDTFWVPQNNDEIINNETRDKNDMLRQNNVMNKKVL